MPIATKTDTFEGITITVRARRGADVWDDFAVKSKLPKEERDANAYRTDKFAEMVTGTVKVEGDLGFQWVSAGSSADHTTAAYQAWCDLSPKLMVFWANLMWDVNQAPLPEENTTAGNV